MRASLKSTPEKSISIKNKMINGDWRGKNKITVTFCHNIPGEKFIKNASLSLSQTTTSKNHKIIENNLQLRTVY